MDEGAGVREWMRTCVTVEADWLGFAPAAYDSPCGGRPRPTRSTRSSQPHGWTGEGPLTDRHHHGSPHPHEGRIHVALALHSFIDRPLSTISFIICPVPRSLALARSDGGLPRFPS